MPASSIPSDETDPTRTLVGQLRRGEADGAALFEKLYREPLIRFCWGYLGRIDECEDAMQEITYKVLSTPHKPDHFRPWVYKIARNQCLNMLRERGRREEYRATAADSRLAGSVTGQLTRLVRDEQREKVAEVVRNLPETLREALRLRYVESLSRSEIAEVLDVPETTVKTRIFEGLRRLREHSSLLEEP